MARGPERHRCCAGRSSRIPTSHAGTGPSMPRMPAHAVLCCCYCAVAALSGVVSGTTTFLSQLVGRSSTIPSQVGCRGTPCDAMRRRATRCHGMPARRALPSQHACTCMQCGSLPTCRSSFTPLTRSSPRACLHSAQCTAACWAQQCSASCQLSGGSHSCLYHPARASESACRWSWRAGAAARQGCTAASTRSWRSCVARWAPSL